MALNNYIRFRDAINMVKSNIEAQEAGMISHIPVLAGKPGIGKTASIEELAYSLGHDFIPIQLSAVFPEEFSGIPDFMNAPEHLAERWSITNSPDAKFTKWSIPELVTVCNTAALRAKERGKGVVVLFDDIHAADPTLERYMFNLFLQKRIGHYQLEDNVYIVGAMNDSSAAGFNGFNAAVLDRMAVYSVEFDFDYWYDQIGGSLHPMIAAFLKQYHQQFMQSEESPKEVTPSPRTWTEASRMFTHMDNKGYFKDEKIAQEKMYMIVNSLVGAKAASKFIEFKIIFDKYNFPEMIRKRDIHKIGDDVVDEIMYAMLVKYVNSKQDAEYVYEMVKENVKRPGFVTNIIVETRNTVKAISQAKRKAKQQNMPQTAWSKSKIAGIDHLKDLLLNSGRESKEMFEYVRIAFTDMEI